MVLERSAGDVGRRGRRDPDPGNAAHLPKGEKGWRKFLPPFWCSTSAEGCAVKRSNSGGTIRSHNLSPSYRAFCNQITLGTEQNGEA